MRIFSLLIVAGLALSSIASLAESKSDGLGEATEANTAHRLAFPNPLFRLLAIEDTLKKKDGTKVDWNALYDKLARSKAKAEGLHGKAALGFATGVRLADGSIAFLAKDAAKLKASAQDAEAYAEKLGLPRKSITSASALARAIADEDWGSAFEEMGWIQQEIVSQVDNKDKNLGMTALVACGAWMQGVRYAADVLVEHMGTQDLSNSLRGPAVIEAITDELTKLPEDVRSTPSVQECFAVFNEIKPLVTIKRDELIPLAKLKHIKDLATRAVEAAMK